MRRINHILALSTLIYFLVNISFHETIRGFELSKKMPIHNLTPALKLDNLTGIEPKDISEIELWFKGYVAWMKREGMEVSPDSFDTLRKITDESIYSPDNTIFFTSGMEPADGVDALDNSNLFMFKITRNDEVYGARTYWIIFTRAKHGDECLFEVYTEKELRKIQETIATRSELLKRDGSDKVLINGYQKHKTQVDEFFKTKWRNGDCYECSEKAGLKELLLLNLVNMKELLEAWGIASDYTQQYVDAVLKKDIVLVKLRDDELPSIYMPDKNGDVRKIKVFAHTSQKRLFLAINPDNGEWAEFESLLGRIERIGVNAVRTSLETSSVKETEIARYRNLTDKIITTLPHEKGVIFGFNAVAVKKESEWVPQNYFDIIKEPVLDSMDKQEVLSKLNRTLQPVDLNVLRGTNSLGEEYVRDYAAAKAGDTLHERTLKIIRLIDKAIAAIKEKEIFASEREDEIRNAKLKAYRDLKRRLQENPHIIPLETPQKIGILAQTKRQEKRLAGIPDVVGFLCSLGIPVCVPKGAGVVKGVNPNGEIIEGCRFNDDIFRQADEVYTPEEYTTLVKIIDAGNEEHTEEKLLEAVDFLFGIKELQPRQIGIMHTLRSTAGKLLTCFNYQHLGDNLGWNRLEDVKTGATLIAYEEIVDDDGEKPLLKGASQKAGVISSLQMAKKLVVLHSTDAGEREATERNVNKALIRFDETNKLPRPDVDLGKYGIKVLIYGGGVVGYHAAEMFLRMGAEVTITEMRPARKKWLYETLRTNGDGKDLKGRDRKVFIIDSRDEESINASLQEAHGINSTPFLIGQTAQTVITQDTLRTLPKGKVFAAPDIDQGGGISLGRTNSSVYTWHDEPWREENGQYFYLVPNMPSLVPRQTSIDIGIGQMRYAPSIALLGLRQTIELYPELGYAVDAHEGRITNPLIQRNSKIKTQLKDEDNKECTMIEHPEKMNDMELTLYIARARKDTHACLEREDIVSCLPMAQFERYKLFLPRQFYRGNEFNEHNQKFENIFDLEIINKKVDSPDFIQNIIDRVGNYHDKTAVLMPKTSTKEQLEKLKANGIRFIIADYNELARARSSKDRKEQEYRKHFQEHTYGIMRLICRLRETDSEPLDDRNPFFRALIFYANTHFGFDNVVADAYVKAIATDNISILINGWLNYRRAERLKIPAYDKVQAPLVSA